MLSLSQASLSEGCPTYSDTSKVFNDPVHSYVPVTELCLKFIDTPQFQRLRDLKQLGSSYFVFQGASHNRFEHSIGVCHLAGQMVDRFSLLQPELAVTDIERESVRLAGLCHDLGHGPFSHVFDNEFIPRVRPSSTWCHEQMSIDLLDVLVEDNSIDIEADQLRQVQDMIMGNVPARPADPFSVPRDFLYEIVNNKRNSIDVDKFDYLARDTYNLGLKSTYDYTRLQLTSRVIDSQICFQAKEVYSVYEMFHTRYSLFKQIYSHKASKAVEYMITDALVLADTAWDRRISKSIDDPREYWKLTDFVLKEIELSREAELQEARDILHRIRCRNLYRFVDEFIIPSQLAARIPKVTSEQISTHNVDGSVRLLPEHIIVHDMKLNYGNKDKNPVDRTKFYREATATEAFHIPRHKVSYILPAEFQERILRVYSRSQDHEIVAAVQKAFRRFLKTFKTNVSTTPDPSSRLYTSPTKGKYPRGHAITGPPSRSNSLGTPSKPFDDFGTPRSVSEGAGAGAGGAGGGAAAEAGGAGAGAGAFADGDKNGSLKRPRSPERPARVLYNDDALGRGGESRGSGVAGFSPGRLDPEAPTSFAGALAGAGFDFGAGRKGTGNSGIVRKGGDEGSKDDGSDLELAGASGPRSLQRPPLSPDMKRQRGPSQ